MRACKGSLVFVAVFVSCLAALAGAERTQSKRKTVVTAGLKTPGVAIPFEALKPEWEALAPTQADWIAFSDSLYVPSADRLQQIDPKTGKTAEAREAAIAAKPCAGMVSAFGSLWAPSCGDGSLLRWDPKSKKETARLTAGVGALSHGIAASTDSIWLLTDKKTTLSRVDPDQNAVVGELRVPAGCHDLTFGETALWLVCPAENKVYRIDPATNLVANQVEVSGEPVALAVGEGSVWVLCRKEGKLERINPKTNKVVKSLELGTPGLAGVIAVGEGSVWLTMPGFPLMRVSPAAEKERVLQQFFGKGGGAVTTSKEAVWLLNAAEHTVWKIDPKRVAATLAE